MRANQATGLSENQAAGQKTEQTLLGLGLIRTLLGTGSRGRGRDRTNLKLEVQVSSSLSWNRWMADKCRAAIGLRSMAELKPDPWGTHNSWTWAKAGAGNAQGHVCLQRPLEWASPPCLLPLKRPVRLEAREALEIKVLLSPRGGPAPNMFSGLSTCAQAWPLDISPQARSQGSRRVEADEGYHVLTGVSGTRFPQPKPRPLPPFLPPPQLPIG